MAERKRRILIVDDSEEDREIYIEYLKSCLNKNLHIECTQNTEEALIKLRDQPYDCILLDFELPDYNGIESIDRFREDRAGQFLPPVIMITGRSTHEIAISALKKGVSDYLVKSDVTSENLSRAVNHAIEKRWIEQELADEKRLLQEEKLKLQHAVAARDEFLSIASHELKTPITALKIQMQLLPRLLSQGVKSDFVKALDLCARSGPQLDRLVNLVNSLLDVTRVSSDRLEIELSEFSISALVLNLVNHLTPLLKSSGIELASDIPNDIFINSDQVRVEQILTNLLTNAAKYAPRTPLELTLSENLSEIEVTVRDYGPGIPIELATKIFERFERGIASTHVSGLGLGLYISKQIAKRLNGTLELVSDGTEVGCKFVLSLPKKIIVI